MATHSSVLARNIPWMEEPDWLQSIGLQRGGHDGATSLQGFEQTDFYLATVHFVKLLKMIYYDFP